MDGSFPLKRDPWLPAPKPVERWQQEIAQARQGYRAKISSKAAAHYLGVHYTTLLEWVRDGEGPEPIKNPPRPGSTALNQHVGFTLEALDTFLANRTGNTIIRGKRSDAASMLREVASLEAVIAGQEAANRLAKAQARARRLGVVCFNTRVDAMEVHPWALDEQGRILGQLWTLGEGVDVDDVLEATLTDALLEPWVNTQARIPYERAMMAILDATRHELIEARDRQQVEDGEANTEPATGPSRGDNRL